jgi:hypothetical protein
LCDFGLARLASTSDGYQKQKLTLFLFVGQVIIKKIKNKKIKHPYFEINLKSNQIKSI